MLNRKMKITIGLSLVFGVGGFIAYRGIERRNIIKALLKELDSKNGGDIFYSYGDLRDFKNVLNGNPYMSWVKNKTKGSDLIYLTRNAITSKRKAIDNAFGVVNDDEDAIYNILNSVNDLFEIAQISQSYKEHYGKSLYAKLINDLLNSEQDKVYEILKSKLKFRVK